MPGKLMNATSRSALLVSLVLHVFVTFPLVGLLVVDGVVQQRLYMHVASKIGQYDVAFIGDSFVEGGYVWADKIGVYNFDVWNYGKGGFRTDQVMSYARRVAENRFKFCVVMSGRNDGIVDSASAEKAFAGSYVVNLEILQQANVEPIVTLILYKNRDPHVKSIDLFNDLLRGYCKEHGVAVIDLPALICSESELREEYAADDVHINASGYSVWAGQIRKILNAKHYM